jgi:hypothetical protein
MEDEEEINRDSLDELSEDELDDTFDEIFSHPWSQREKVEFAIMLSNYKSKIDGVVTQIDDIKRVVEMKMKQTYKR